MSRPRPRVADLRRRVRPRRALALGALGLGCVALGACGRDTPPPTGQAPHRVAVLLTDAPFPYDSVARVELYVERIELSPAADTSAANADWVAVAVPRRRFDLLALQNGTTALLGESQVGVDRFRSVRMVLDTDSSAVIDLSGAPVRVDWGASAGRATLHALVEAPLEVAGEDGAVVIDFDVGRSFLCVDAYCREPLRFSPTLRAVTRGGTGAISGVVRGDTLSTEGPLLRHATVAVLRGDPGRPPEEWSVVATGRTDALGRYTIAFLPAGTYAVRADAPRDTRYSSGYLTGVAVPAGPARVVDDIRLSPGSRAGVELRASTDSLFVGDTTLVQLLNPPPPGPDGAPAPVRWTSSDTTVIRLRFPGQSAVQAQAVGSGTATVTAAYEGRAASVAFRVLPRPSLAAFLLTPTRATIWLPSDSVMISARQVDDAGRIGGGTGAVSWSLDDPAVGRFSHASGGLAVVRGIASGVVTVTATLGDRRATATILVRPLPATAEFHLRPEAQVVVATEMGASAYIWAALVDGSGTRAASDVTWSVSDSTVLAAPSGGFGTGPNFMARALRPGTVTVTAHRAGARATATVQVYGGPGAR